MLGTGRAPNSADGLFRLNVRRPDDRRPAEFPGGEIVLLTRLCEGQIGIIGPSLDLAP